MEDLCCKIRGRVVYTLKEPAKLERQEEFLKTRNTQKQVVEKSWPVASVSEHWERLSGGGVRMWAFLGADFSHWA